MRERLYKDHFSPLSLNKTYANAKKARDYFMNLPEVQTVEFQVGRPDGGDPTGPFNSEYYVGLKPYDQWKNGATEERIEETARDGLKKMFPNADINISQYIEDNLEEVMSGVKGENSVKIFGDDLIKLESIAKEVETGLNSTTGMEDVGIFKELGQPNLLINVEPGKRRCARVNCAGSP